MQKKTLQIVKIIERLKVALDTKTDIELAKALGVSHATISAWKNRETIGDWELVLGMISGKGINSNWLLTGEGEMLHKPDENARKIEAIQAILNSAPTSD